jgi:signal transduction histidine kinase
MIMLLRAEAGSAGRDALAPAGLERLPMLIEQATGTGLEVRLDGRAPDGLPALVDQAGYRIVHEALANARKHAPGAPVRVELATAGDRFTVTVSNPLPETVVLSHPALSAGTGLWSMAERAAQFGGELTAGPDGPLWRVRAVLPLPRPEATA